MTKVAVLPYVTRVLFQFFIKMENVSFEIEREVVEKAGKRARRASSKDEEKEVERVVATSVLLQLREDVKRMSCQLDALTKRFDKHEGRMEERLDEIREKMFEQRQEVEELRREVGEMREEVKEVSVLREEVREMKKRCDRDGEKRMQEVKEIRRKAIDQEARSRRENLLFFNVAEEHNEVCNHKLRGIIKNSMGIARDIPIERCHRLGPHREGNSKPRPIIARFLRYTDKSEILAQRRRLQRPMGVSEDLPLPTRKARQSLGQEVKDARDSGKRASIAYPARLIIDGQLVREVDPASF